MGAGGRSFEYCRPDHNIKDLEAVTVLMLYKIWLLLYKFRSFFVHGTRLWLVEVSHFKIAAAASFLWFTCFA